MREGFRCQFSTPGNPSSALAPPQATASAEARSEAEGVRRSVTRRVHRRVTAGKAALTAFRGNLISQ